MGFKRTLIAAVFLTVLTIAAISGTSDFVEVYIGMSLEDYRSNENVFDEDKTDIDAIRVGGIKYTVIHYEFLNYAVVEGSGKTLSYSYYADPFFVIFADDTLYTMGYPYEFKRDTSMHFHMLADELNNFAR